MGRILFIRGGAIGDFILTLPAVQLLRDSLPGNQIEILGYRPILELAQEFGFADATRWMEHRTLAPFFAPGATLDPELSSWFAGFNVVISHLYDPDDIFHTNLRLCGVKTLLTGPHRITEPGPHAARQLAAPLEHLALFLENPAPVFPFTEPAGTSGLTALHPGSGSPRKNWGIDNWLAVCTALGGPFLLVSGEAEEKTIAPLKDALRQARIPFESLEHQPLPAVARRLRTCRAFLGHDSGISHLAAACGLPCLLLFGPTDPAVWAPQNPAVRTLRAPQGRLDLITPDEVITAARQLIPV